MRSARLRSAHRARAGWPAGGGAGPRPTSLRALRGRARRRGPAPGGPAQLLRPDRGRRAPGGELGVPGPRGAVRQLRGVSLRLADHAAVVERRGDRPRHARRVLPLLRPRPGGAGDQRQVRPADRHPAVSQREAAGLRPGAGRPGGGGALGPVPLPGRPAHLGGHGQGAGGSARRCRGHRRHRAEAPRHVRGGRRSLLELRIHGARRRVRRGPGAEVLGREAVRIRDRRHRADRRQGARGGAGGPEGVRPVRSHRARRGDADPSGQAAAGPRRAGGGACSRAGRRAR